MRLGAWILTQTHRDDVVGDLAKLVAQDPDFPEASGYQGVLDYLTERNAGSVTLEALEEARKIYDLKEYEEE